MSNVKKTTKIGERKVTTSKPAVRKTARLTPAPEMVQAASAPVSQPTVTEFIVQNALEGPLYISDIGMEFGGLEVRDLTWEDPSLVKRSQDLRRALTCGQLIRITQAQWDQIMYQKAAHARAETQRISRTRTRTVNVNGNQVQAEVLNLNKADGGKAAQDVVSTAGHANDPMSYATAFAEARNQYDDRGQTLDAYTFSQIVQNRPSVIATLLRGDSMFDDGITSGAIGRGRATVITPGDGFNTNVSQMNMTNYNRDQRLAGSSTMGMGSLQNDTGYIDPTNPHLMPNVHIPDMVDLDNLDEDDDAGYAEEIDLSNDSNDNGLRRL